jgi:YVTN family beta-propeller protein
VGDGWVGCSFSDDCFPFDLTTYASGAVIDLLPEGNYPYDATIKPDDSEVWFVGASGDGVVVIDRATNTVVQRIATSEYAISVAFSSDGSMAVVSSRDSEVLDVIDTTTYTVTSSLPIPTGYLGAGNVAHDPVSGKFYLVDYFDEILYEIAADASAVLDQTTLGNSLWQLVVSPVGDFVYVTDRGTDQVRIIELATLSEVGTYPVGDDPWGIDITADGATLVVACEDSHEVVIIDVATGNSTSLALDPDADPRDVDIRDESGLAFVCGGRVGTTSNPVYVIDIPTRTLADTFEAPGSNTNVIAVQAQMSDVGTSATELPTSAAKLHANYPNPFNPQTTIPFDLTRGDHVRLAVYDLRGRLVRVLADEHLGAGQHERVWAGRDARGQRVPSGNYLYRLVTGDEVQTREMTLVK